MLALKLINGNDMKTYSLVRFHNSLHLDIHIHLDMFGMFLVLDVHVELDKRTLVCRCQRNQLDHIVVVLQLPPPKCAVLERPQPAQGAQLTRI